MPRRLDMPGPTALSRQSNLDWWG